MKKLLMTLTMGQSYPMPKPAPPKINATLGDGVNSHSPENDIRPTDIEDMSLGSSANGSRIIVSSKRTVELEGGVRLELRVTEPEPAK